MGITASTVYLTSKGTSCPSKPSAVVMDIYEQSTRNLGPAEAHTLFRAMLPYFAATLGDRLPELINAFKEYNAS